MKTSPMNYGIKLNFSSKLETVNVNVLDNKVGAQAPSLPPPDVVHGQSKAPKEQQRVFLC